MRKKTALILVVVMLALCMAGLSSCASYTEGAATTGYAFVQRIADKDYEGAYDYIYSFTSDVQSKQDFVDRFTNIYKALDIEDVTLISRVVEPVEGVIDEYSLSYTLNMQSELLGMLTYNFEAEIISGPLGFAVIYDPGLILPIMEEGDKVRVLNQSGVRGEIFSSEGKMLAKNDYAQSIYVDIDKNPDINAIKSFLAAEYGADVEKVQKKYDNAIENDYTLEVLMTFPRNTLTEADIEKITAVNGLGVDDERLTPTRYYPLADNAAHLVGYMGTPTEAQVEKNPDLAKVALIGQSGIEAAYEDTLKATDGRIIYIEDDRGEIKQVLYEEPKSDGADVYLTIDTDMQNSAYTLLASNCKEGQSGAAIVMDYESGDVKAMVSYPSFDTNLFNFPIEKKVWDYYTDEKNLTPLFSRTTQALYMPGSTFKPFTAVLPIEAGIMVDGVEPQLNIEDNKWYPDPVKYSWQYDYIGRTNVPAQPFDFEHSMKSSDNIYFAYYAMQIDRPTFKAYMESIGIGEAPDFEIPVTKSSLMNEGSEWNIGLQARAGYGMGELHITPLHLASMYTALVNGGDIINPTVVGKVSRTVDNEETIEWENQRTIFKESIMKQSTIDMIMPTLRRVVTDGTAYTANLQGISTLVAKTGTAQIGQDKSREVNWIVAIDRSSDNPLIYLVVVDTKTNEGTQPKLAVLRGLVSESYYNGALMGSLGSVDYGYTAVSTQTGGGDDDTVQDSSENNNDNADTGDTGGGGDAGDNDDSGGDSNNGDDSGDGGDGGEGGDVPVPEQSE